MYLIKPGQKEKRGVLSIDGPAKSQSPAPDYLYGHGNEYGHTWAEINHVCASAFLQLMGRGGYNEAAAESRQRIAADTEKERDRLAQLNDNHRQAGLMSFIDHVAICKQAIGALKREGLRFWVDADELIAEGCLKLVESDVRDVGLAVVVARNAMRTFVRRNRRQYDGRVYVTERGGRPVNQSESAISGDAWDVLLYLRGTLAPARDDINLVEAMDGLTYQQYEIVMMRYW